MDPRMHRDDSPTGCHMLRRYWPPTSNSARVIWPSEHTRTASTSTAKTFWSRITAWPKRLSCERLSSSALLRFGGL